MLRLGAEAGPFLLKPNLAELEQALGAQLRTLRAIRDAALIFLRKGASHVVVSMGAMGAMYVSEARTLYAPALRVEARSTVGAGDAMVGGMLLGCKRAETWRRPSAMHCRRRCQRDDRGHAAHSPRGL